MSVDAHYFDVLYRHADPWGYRTRWYEQRKRALLLAVLDRPRYRRALELGCSIGETTAMLASRCMELVATDGNARAVRAARERVAGMSRVLIVRMRHPAQWPHAVFDLVVFSELGYYLDAGALDATVRHIAGSLDCDALVVACHWRWPIAGCPWTGDEVHAHIDRGLALPRIVHHEEPDVMIDAWVRGGRSVASVEGLV